MPPARAAATLVFLLAGAVNASFAARVPAVQDRLGLSAGQLGLAFLALEAGAVVGLPGGGVLCARIRSRWALRAGFGAYPAALLGVALAPSVGALALALAVMAGANSVIDVAMNTQGVELERRHGRPLMSSLHAGHSLGVLAGGLGATAAAAAGVPLAAHFAAVAAIGLLAGEAATRPLVDEERGDGPVLARPSRTVLALGAVAFCAFLIDGAVNDWSAAHVRGERAGSPALAAAAFTAFALALFLGRMAGDRVVARVGRVRAVRGAGLVAAAGTALALAGPGAVAALAGWAVLGLGIAVLAPTVMGAAGTVPDVPTPVAIAAVTTIGYLGSFTGPPLIGGLAEVVGLTAALGVLAVAALAAAALAQATAVS